MRTRTWISAVAATGLLAAGAAVPAIAAAGNAATENSSSSGAEHRRMDGQNGMPNMVRMHEQMMGDHSEDEAPSAPAGEEQGEDR